MQSILGVRHVVLFLLCAFSFSFMAILNNPGSLQESILTHFNVSNSEYALLYSVSSWASCLDVLHGYIIERYWGLKIATFIYIAVVLAGSGLIIAGAYALSFTMFVVGRLIYGFGSNPLILTLNGYILHWYGYGKDINTAYCLNGSMIFLGGSAIFFVSENIMQWAKQHYTEDRALSFTIILETVGLVVLMCVTMGIVASMYKKKTEGNQPMMEPGKPSPLDITTAQASDPDSSDGPPAESDKTQGKPPTQTLIPEKKLTTLDYILFPLPFWAFMLTCFLYFVSLMTFMSFSQDFLVTEYEISVSEASNYAGMVNLISFALSIPAGLIMDWIGFNLSFTSFGILATLLAHSIFVFARITLILPLVLISIGFTLASSIWSQIAYMVEPHQAIIAYGFTQTGANGAIALGSLFAGIVVDKYRYYGFEVYLFAIIVGSLPGLILMWLADWYRGFILNSPAKCKEDRWNARHSKKNIAQEITIKEILD